VPTHCEIDFRKGKNVSAGEAGRGWKFFLTLDDLGQKIYYDNCILVCQDDGGPPSRSFRQGNFAGREMVEKAKVYLSQQLTRIHRYMHGFTFKLFLNRSLLD